MPPCYLWMQEHIFQDLMVFILLSAGPESELGLNTGAGKPVVFRKWVMWVRVWFSFLAHCGTPLPIPWYHGYVRVNSNKVILIFTVFFLFLLAFFSKFFMSHRDGTKYGTVSHTYIFASYHQPTLSSYFHSHSTSKTM